MGVPETLTFEFFKHPTTLSTASDAAVLAIYRDVSASSVVVVGTILVLSLLASLIGMEKPYAS